MLVQYDMDLVVRKPGFGVSNKTSLKLVSLATETSLFCS